jgi:hypothetical protein
VKEIENEVSKNNIVFIMTDFQFRETAATTSTRRRGKVERRKDWRSVPGNAASKDTKLFCVTYAAPKYARVFIPAKFLGQIS